MLSLYLHEQLKLIHNAHTWDSVYWRVDRTIDLLKQRQPILTNKDTWPRLSYHVRTYIESCPTCQKMSHILVAIKASRFILSSLRPMVQISMDTIRPLPQDEKGNIYIIVLIDNFTRYLELLAAKDVKAETAARALSL